MIFVDLEEDYDAKSLKILFEIVMKSGLSKTYVRATWNIYKETNSLVRVGNSLSERFQRTWPKITFDVFSNNWKRKHQSKIPNPINIYCIKFLLNKYNFSGTSYQESNETSPQFIILLIAAKQNLIS